MTAGPQVRRSGMPCRAVPCRAVPCRAVPCRAMPSRAMLCHAVPCSFDWHVLLSTACACAAHHRLPCPRVAPKLCVSVPPPWRQVPGYTLLVGRGLFSYGRFNCTGSLRCAACGRSAACKGGWHRRAGKCRQQIGMPLASAPHLTTTAPRPPLLPHPAGRRSKSVCCGCRLIRQQRTATQIRNARVSS